MRNKHPKFAQVSGLAIFCILSIGIIATSFAEEKERPLNVALNSMVGKWTTFQKDDKSGNGQNWQIEWSKKGTYLDYYVETIIKNQAAFNGTGFILYDSESDTYRIFLMMDNGALHESVGKKINTDSYEFRVATYGVPNAVFPDQSYKLRVTPTEMVGEYTVIKEDGVIDRSSVARITLRRREQ